MKLMIMHSVVYMYLLTDWEGWMGKYCQDVWTEHTYKYMD